MSYTNTFITVAEDCPVAEGIVPAFKAEEPSVAAITYELLSAKPYQLTQEDLIFAVHVRCRRIPEEELATSREAIWAELFRKEHPCLRASPLTKRYGWGAHYDPLGRIALYPMESEAYRSFATPRDGLRVLAAMRNKRA